MTIITAVSVGSNQHVFDDMWEENGFIYTKSERGKKRSPLDRNRAGDLSVSINAFTAERDIQLHHKGFDL